MDRIEITEPVMMTSPKVAVEDMSVVGALMLLLYEYYGGRLSNFGVFVVESILDKATQEQLEEASFLVSCATRDDKRRQKFPASVRAQFDPNLFE